MRSHSAIFLCSGVEECTVGHFAPLPTQAPYAPATADLPALHASTSWQRIKFLGGNLANRMNPQPGIRPQRQAFTSSVHCLSVDELALIPISNYELREQCRLFTNSLSLVMKT